MEAQFAELAANPDILLATPGEVLPLLPCRDGSTCGNVDWRHPVFEHFEGPRSCRLTVSCFCAGRLMHHLQEVEGMSLQTVQYCVFDEADQLFEMGFAEQLRAVLSKMGDARQTLLFSATLPAALAEFARAGLKNPAFVRLDADTKLSPNLQLCFACLRCGLSLIALFQLTSDWQMLENVQAFTSKWPSRYVVIELQ